MEENRTNRSEGMSVDFQRLIKTLLNKSWLIAAISVLCAVVILLGTLFFIAPKYESSAMFYVNNGSLSLDGDFLGLSSGDLSASRNLVDSYIVILDSRETLTAVIDYASVDLSYEELQEMITATAVNNTEIFEVVVTSPDPQEAERIASAIAYILPKRISSIIENTSAKVVDSAVVASKPSSPNYTVNALVGFLIGFVAAVGVIALREIFDISIRTEEDIALSCPHPILAEVPDMAAPGKGAYYGYGAAKKGKYAFASQPRKQALVGPDISFAASEAYKLLRTKLQFSFADESDCHVIGLSSALSGEGKSLTAVNLAFALSQLDKKVLLVDCDMRRPTLAEKLGILKYPGLSSYLTRQCHLNELVQDCGIEGNETAFQVITAGQNPPNPVELLSSDRMKKALGVLREVYDYVILDLPPVGEVSDAMAIAKETDGILLVVRQNLCNRIVLADAVQQFEFINAKTLGIVFNCTGEKSGKYGKNYYRKGYGYSRAAAPRAAANQSGKAEE